MTTEGTVKFEITKSGYYGYLVAIHPTEGVLNFARSFTRRSALIRHVRRYYPYAEFAD